MKKSLKQTIKNIAKGVRSWAEDMHKKQPFHYTEDLCGLCAIASAKLHKELKKQKIKSEIHFIDYHVFLMVDNYILDVTATQFGYRNKIIFRRNKKNNPHCWNSSEVFQDTKELIMKQCKEGWPREQVARN